MGEKFAPGRDAGADGGVQSISRAIRLLSMTAQLSARGARLTDLSRLSGLSVGTVHRILKTLEAEDMVLQDETTRRYHIAPLVYDIGLAARSRQPQLQRCLPQFMETVLRLSLPIYVIARSGLDAITIHHVLGQNVQPIGGGPGVRNPLGLGAGGIMLLASMPTKSSNSFIDKNAERYCLRAGQNADRVRNAVEAARRRGYAISECSAAVHALAVTVPRADSTMSVAVKVPVVRLANRDSAVRQIVRPLQALVREIGPMLSLETSPPFDGGGTRRAATAFS